VSSYWIDTDTLVWSNNNAYPLGSIVGEPFWKMIEDAVGSGLIKMPRHVFKEMTERKKGTKDTLAFWLEEHEGRHQSLCLPSTKEIQELSGRIGDFIFSPENKYRTYHALRFAKGADAWLIAYASLDKGVVVSREKPEPNSRKPKVPDLCVKFGVKFITLHKLVFCLEHRIPPEHCTDPYKD
jgi:hypothetical protein